MITQSKTPIAIGDLQGISARITNAFVQHGYNVVANSWKVTISTEVAVSGLTNRRVSDVTRVAETA